jgi:tricorn protease
VLRRAAQVEKLSGGKLGYLHIRAMSEPSVRDFERDLYAAAHGKEGLVIDVRDNGGGSTADILLASLTAPNHAYTIPRGVDPATVAKDAYPRDRRLIYGYVRPINVLINQHSFSNAEIFAHAISTIKRGKLVGTATFGGVISTGAMTLIDGTTVRTPFRGWYLPDGRDQENNGAQPDVNVPQLPTDEAAGVDRQLEAAVNELLGRVGTGK